MKKVVYISWEHLSEKLERDWYLSYLSMKDVPVEYWDAAALLLGDTNDPTLSRPYVISVKNYDQFEQMLRQNAGQNVVYVLIVWYESRFYRLFRLLTRYECRLFFILWGNSPIQKRKTGKLIHYLIRSPRRLIARVFNKMLTSLSLSMGLVKQYDVIFVAGTASIPDPSAKTKIVPFNLCDYDNYLLARDAERMVKVKYCVFLDINLGHHLDVRIAKLGAQIDPVMYLKILNAFFSRIEQKNVLRVVIAAHPSSHYNQTDFNGRTILKNVTPELVKDAEFVISHHSASISYAVLNRKPLLFIYTDEMNAIYRDTVVAWIRDIAGFLKAPVYNIDRIQDYAEVTAVPVDEEAYERFKYGYLTTKETEGRLNNEIFYRELLA